MRMSMRLHNLAKWSLLCVESIAFMFIPSIFRVLPYSTSFMMNLQRMTPQEVKSLTWRECTEISYSICSAGFVTMVFASMFLYNAYMNVVINALCLVFVLTSAGPEHVFSAHASNVVTIIINKRAGNMCCICMEQFSYYSHVRVTSCNHCFHADCMARWEDHGRGCPLCRQR